MIHSIDPGILFLQEEDVIKAGVLDMKMTLAAVEKTYKMLGEGQIINPPKTHIGMPIGSGENWQSFFNSMPCYIGGDVNVGGTKWAAESKKNSSIPGIPYGIDITVLSDPETVLPFCILDGTLITAMRTSAVGGLFAKYTAPEGTDTVTLVGAGVIGRTMVMAVCEALPTVKKIYMCDLDLDKAEGLKKDYEGVYDVEIIPTADAKAAAEKSQVVITETTARKPFIDKSWLRPGLTIINMGSMEADLETVASSDIIAVDYWDQIVTYESKAAYHLHRAGKLDKEQVVELSDMVLGKWKGRTDAAQTINCNSLGLGALDIMIGYMLFENARKMGLGTMVKLWDKPLWE
ncbi:MAG: ornithine cyclodeaminase family protein [Pygmaiobacter massiliensis]|nr:ornithine cyclodeaminase family protein [Pygmaiobacter massiliensis]